MYYYHWLGAQASTALWNEYKKHILEYVELDRHSSRTAAENTATENKPVERAREVITDLKAGRIPRSVVKDLGDAVAESTRNSGVGDAIGRNWR